MLSGCASYPTSNKSKSEITTLNPLVYEQPITLMEVVDANSSENSRGLITTDILIEGANLAIQGVKSVIDKSQEKFTQTYIGGLNNLKFYSANSKSGMLDPDKISFRGFEISRTFLSKEDNRELAVYARFVLDESKFQDIYFNSKFYFRLDSISVNYSKVKLNDKKWYLPWSWFIKKDYNINLDLDIKITANWIDENGTINHDKPFGQFILPLRKIPMNPDNPERTEYFNKLKGMQVSGSSYIIPRSRTFCTGSNGELEPCYGRGDFNILVSATESSKSDFVTQKLSEHSDDIFNGVKGEDLLNAVNGIKRN